MSESALIWSDALTIRDPAARGIINRLASVADDDDCAWMRVDDLAQRVGVSVRTIQSRLRKLENPDPDASSAEGFGFALIRATGRMHRIGTRSVPIYELLVDHELVGSVLRERKARKLADAERRSMGAAACTHRSEAIDTVCTPMGATVCTPNETIRDSEFTNVHSERARSPKGVAEAILAAWPEVHRTRSSVREITGAVSGEVRGGADLVRIEAAALAYAANPKAWGVSGEPMAPHKLITSGRWETFVPVAGDAKGSARARTAFACDRFRRVVLAAKGPTWVASYLDPCGWDAETRTVDPRLKDRAAKLRSEIGDLLKSEGVKLKGLG